MELLVFFLDNDMAEELVVIRNLKKHFWTSNGIVKAVNGVSFSIMREETFGLVGESGSGKSTMGYTLLGVYQPTGGEILLRGKNINKALRSRPKSLRREIQMVFQDPGTTLNPRKQVGKILALPLQVYGVLKHERRSRLEELLDLVGLPHDYLFKYPHELGGGERQTVAIARALAAGPSLIILDEPTSALDVSIQAKIINVLVETQKKLNLTYLFITHDLSLMRNVATRVAIMYLGKVCELAPTAEFFRNPLHPYTQMLLSSIPVLSDEEEALKPKKIQSKGEIPSPVNIPSGCSFHQRCSLRGDICSVEDPEMVEIELGHFVSCNRYRENDQSREAKVYDNTH